MSVTVSPASVVGIPVSAAVAGANQGSVVASPALQSASPDSVDGAVATTQVNDFESILSPMLTAGAVTSAVLTVTPAGQSLPMPESMPAALPTENDLALSLQSQVTATAAQGSPLPPDGNNLPGLVDDPAADLAAVMCEELGVAADAQNLLPAKNGAVTTTLSTSAKDTPQDPALSDLAAALALPIPLQAQLSTDLPTTGADDVADTPSPDELPSADVSLLAANGLPLSTAVVAPVATPAATTLAQSAAIVAQASVTPLSVSDQPATKLSATDTADSNAITAASSNADELPVDAQMLAVDIGTPSTETVSVDKETFGRLLASSQLADSISGGGAQRGDAAMSSAEPARPPSGAIAYRLQGQEMVATTLVPQSFDSDSWGNEIGERVAWFSSNHIQHAEIELDPPELGPLQVRISTQNDQTTVSFTSHHAGVREVLDQNLPKLKELFADQGLNLVQADVSERRNPSQDHHGGGSSDNAGNGELAADEELATVDADVRQVLTTRRGLIDAFA